MENISDESTTSNNEGSNCEAIAASSFVHHFISTYKTIGLPLTVSSLEDILNECSSLDLKKRKILILYLHNAKSKFSKTFCTNLIKKEISALLANTFCILGWNIENVEYHSALKKALDKYYPNLSLIKLLLVDKKCAAFFIVPVNNSFSLSSWMGDNVSDSDFRKAIAKMRKEFLAENEVEKQLNEGSTENKAFTSRSYQQLMLDMLGDRDYDSFESHEHEELKKKIGYSLYGVPHEDTGYTSKEMNEIEKYYKTIATEANRYSKWNGLIRIAFIFVCVEPLPAEKLKRKEKYDDYDPKTDLMPLPIFVLRKCKDSKSPCRIFIDHQQRVYQSWTAYLQNNKLHECIMAFPKNGRYSCDANGAVLLGAQLSPACGVPAKILRGTDVASGVAGVVSTGIVVATLIPAITVAPALLVGAGVAGIGAGLYGITRSVVSLVDRRIHKETLSFANSEARGAYFNIIGGAVGFVGIGANIALAQLAARGAQIGRGTKATVNVINIANLMVNGSAVINSGYDMVDHWLNENRKPSLLAVVQLSSSVLFFGHAVYNFKFAGTVIEEAQYKTLKDYQDSLRSNRHRKTFNKLVKETVRQNEGNIVKGQAEIIKTLKQIQNKDEVFASLTRANKDLNKQDIKFSARGGEIFLNDVKIDMDLFSTMNKMERSTFLLEIPTMEKVNAVPSQNVVDIKSHLPSSLSSIGINEITLAGKFLCAVFGPENPTIQLKLLDAARILIEYLQCNEPHLMTYLNTLFPNNKYYLEIILLITEVFRLLAQDKEDMYQRWREDHSSPQEEYFWQLSPEKIQRAKQLLEFTILPMLLGNNLKQQCLPLLLKYFHVWITKQINEERMAKENRMQRIGPSTLQKCSVCEGNYHSGFL